MNLLPQKSCLDFVKEHLLSLIEDGPISKAESLWLCATDPDKEAIAMDDIFMMLCCIDSETKRLGYIDRIYDHLVKKVVEWKNQGIAVRKLNKRELKNRVAFFLKKQLPGEDAKTQKEVDVRHSFTNLISLPATRLNENEDLDFWEVHYRTLQDGTRIFKEVVIDVKNLIEVLKKFGFRRYDLPGGFSFVKVNNNIVDEVLPQQIQDEFSKYLQTLPDMVSENVFKSDLERKIIKQSETLFGKSRLSWLKSDEPIIFNEDTKTESFIYFRNGYVKCIQGDYSFHNYCELHNSIWQSQLKGREFVKLDFGDKKIFERCHFSKFVWNVAGSNVERCLSLMSLIGYLCHSFTETKLKAVVFTDSKIDDGNNGRTGKTLVGKAIEKIRDVCELNGKEFRADKNFKYQEANLSTQILFLNDIKKNFDLEALYNDITEGITIEKKNQTSVKKKVKYLITTNATIRTNGDSSKDRVIEFEFSEHYSAGRTPEHEFNHWFFNDWNKEEWNRFDNFMIECICIYLEEGIISPDPVNLHKRKIIDQSSKQFFDYIESENIMP